MADTEAEHLLLEVQKLILGLTIERLRGMVATLGLVEGPEDDSKSRLSLIKSVNQYLEHNLIECGSEGLKFLKQLQEEMIAETRSQSQPNTNSSYTLNEMQETSPKRSVQTNLSSNCMYGNRGFPGSFDQLIPPLTQQFGLPLGIKVEPSSPKLKYAPEVCKLDFEQHPAVHDNKPIFRKEFKIMGQIGEHGQKNKITFSNLARQIESGLSKGYSQTDIIDAVIN